MTVYTLDRKDETLATLLDKATHEGEILIQGESGARFVLKPDTRCSPLDVEGVHLDISRDEIVAIVRESKTRL